MIIFILHGFASATPNSKSTFFEQAFPDANIVNLNYSFNPVIGVNQLKIGVVHNINKYNDEELIFVGTSLGGFYAQHLALIFNGKAIAINPTIEPEKTLSQYIGRNINFVTRDEFNFTAEMAAGYNDIKIGLGKVPTLVLLDADDEIINTKDSEQCFLGKASVVRFPGGSHRFDHLEEALPFISKFINRIVA